MYICISAYIHIYVYIYVYKGVSTYESISINTYIHKSMYTFFVAFPRDVQCLGGHLCLVCGLLAGSSSVAEPMISKKQLKELGKAVEKALLVKPIKPASVAELKVDKKQAAATKKKQSKATNTR